MRQPHAHKIKNLRNFTTAESINLPQKIKERATPALSLVIFGLNLAKQAAEIGLA